MDKDEEMMLDEVEDLTLLSEDFRKKLYDQLFDFCKKYNASTGAVINFMLLISGEIITKTVANLIYSARIEKKSFSLEEIIEMKLEMLGALENFLTLGIKKGEE